MSTVSVFQVSAGRRLVAHQPAIAASTLKALSNPGATPSMIAPSPIATSDARYQRRRESERREWDCAFIRSPFANAPPVISSTARSGQPIMKPVPKTTGSRQRFDQKGTDRDAVARKVMTPPLNEP